MSKVQLDLTGYPGAGQDDLAFTVVPSFGAKKAEFFTFENSDRCRFKL